MDSGGKDDDKKGDEMDRFPLINQQKDSCGNMLNAAKTIKEECDEMVRNFRRMQQDIRQECNRLQDIETHLLGQYEMQQRFKSIKITDEGDTETELANLFRALEYNLVEYVFINSKSAKITLEYKDKYFVKFMFGEKCELLDIEPEHPNFKQIQEEVKYSNSLFYMLVNLPGQVD